MLRLILIYLLLNFAAFKDAKQFNIINYGAKGDAITLNTNTIQKAIDDAHANGGGTVIIPKGIFLSGSIFLKTGVTLQLEKGGTLLGSTNIIDYKPIHVWKALIIADSCSHIAITGKGVIDGQGAKLALNIDSLFYRGEIDSHYYEFSEKRVYATLRPQIIQFQKCDDIKITDVTIKNSACWVQTYEKCSNLAIDNITVLSDEYWNNDGIDVIDCKNVSITNCFINASDDGICLKSEDLTKTYFSDSIYISNCTIRSSASAVKFGTSLVSGIKNVVIKNIKIYDTYRSAIAIESTQGGYIENVLIENIVAKNTGNALFIRIGRIRGAPKAGPLKNVVIRNMKVWVPFAPPDIKYNIRGPALPFFHNVFPSSITGNPGVFVENVLLENIEIIYPGKGNKAFANLPLWRVKSIPDLETAYPEFSMFGELPAWGFYIRHVKGLEMKNIKLKILEPDYRPSIVFDNVHDVKINNLNIIGDSKKHAYFAIDTTNFMHLN